MFFEVSDLFKVVFLGLYFRFSPQYFTRPGPLATERGRCFRKADLTEDPTCDLRATDTGADFHP